MDAWSLIFSALGLAVFLEGLPYFASPRGVRRAAEHLSRMSDGTMRLTGFTLMVAGLLVTYLTLH